MSRKETMSCLFCQAFLVAALLTSVVMGGCRADIPPGPLVDPAKAALLSDARKRELDIQLANELATWNTNTRRFGVDEALMESEAWRAMPEVEKERIRWSPFASREAWFAELAEQGYEMAAIAARIVKPKQGRAVPDETAFNRLKVLADAGDHSALCFASILLFKLTASQPAPYTDEEARRYQKTGAELGLPVCRTREAFLIGSGSHGYAWDGDRAREQLHEGARVGLYEAHLRLFNAYAHISERERFTNLSTVRAALCWGRLASLHKPGVAYYYLANIKSAAWNKDNLSRQADRPELMALAKDGDLHTTPFEAKPTTPEDCIQLEQER